MWGPLRREGVIGGCGHRPEMLPLQNQLRSQLLKVVMMSPVNVKSVVVSKYQLIHSQALSSSTNTLCTV